MSRQVYFYDPPDRFVAGTVGLPGRRTFFLQASSGPRVTSVALEKTQVAALAERIDELLDEVVRRTGGNSPVPAAAPSERATPHRSTLPVDEEFRVGTMALAWDGDEQRMIIEASGPGRAGSRKRRGPRGGRGTAPPGRRERPAHAPRTADRGSGQGLRQASARRRQRGAPAMPAVQPAARPGRTRMSAPERIPPRSVTATELLAKGELTVRGRVREASNAVLYCSVS